MVRSRALPVAYALLAACHAVAWADAGPVEVVKKLNAGLDGVLRQSAQLDYKARYGRLVPILDEAFDFEFMAHQAIGKPWDDLKVEDQRRWVTAFTTLTYATYAGRLNHYTGQSFEILDSEEAAHDTMVVRGKVTDPAGENVDLTYRLKQTDARWKVIDVYLKGSVSEVALRRSEYASVLKRSGFEALIEAVSKRVEQLAAGVPAT